MSIPALFADHVARTPDAVAMTFEGRSMTYLEFDEAANRMAHLLIAHGAGPGRDVALLLDRSADAVIAIIAVLKTGRGVSADRPDGACGPAAVRDRRRRDRWR